MDKKTKRKYYCGLIIKGLKVEILLFVNFFENERKSEMKNSNDKYIMKI